MLCDCDIKEKGFYCCVFPKGSAEKQSNESFCTSSCGTQSEWGRKPCRSRTTVYAIKKQMNDDEDFNATITQQLQTFSSVSQSQSIGWFKQKLDNNCQATRIVTKILFNFLDPPSIYSIKWCAEPQRHASA